MLVAGVRLGTFASAAALLSCLAGCGDNLTLATPANDAGPEAAAVDAGGDAAVVGCTPVFWRTYVSRVIDLPYEGHALAMLAAIANPGYAESLRTGNAIYLWDLVGWTDPPGPEGPDTALHMYQGLAAHQPADPTTYFTGTGEFVVPAANFDLDCQPTSPWAETWITNAELHGRTPRWTFVAPGVGTVEFADAVLEAKFNEDYTEFDGTVTTTWTICGLSKALFPGTTQGTFLDMLVNVFAPEGAHPDVDRDGDGLEQLVGNGQTVVACVDGDGTIIEGHDCPCDPRMADGYTTILHGIQIRATILGVDQTGQ